ncbi:hypothetical protein [Pseudoflavonifractor phocaeensis]|uniref:hypothetical protein n=1 Tax=Pseudoflavonifractor phocaeensis TaxID=1870988 RepID=UPI00195BDB12|nr:hypothetical protein [Pseudoflavonifractor phocaeensis]MBM6927244.1 hypothetical protein [Pseudoflavonifractor phocaeensis]
MQWTILDFNFPDELPFKFLKEQFGDQAEIYLSYVSIPLDEMPEQPEGLSTTHDNRPELLEYTEGAVTKVNLTDGSIEAMRSFAERAAKYGVYQIYQPVIPTPTVPANYRICLPEVCIAPERACDFDDNGYCTKCHRTHCESRVVHPEFSDI